MTRHEQYDQESERNIARETLLFGSTMCVRFIPVFVMSDRLVTVAAVTHSVANGSMDYLDLIKVIKLESFDYNMINEHYHLCKT